MIVDNKANVYDFQVLIKHLMKQLDFGQNDHLNNIICDSSDSICQSSQLTIQDDIRNLNGRDGTVTPDEIKHDFANNVQVLDQQVQNKRAYLSPEIARTGQTTNRRGKSSKGEELDFSSLNENEMNLDQSVLMKALQQHALPPQNADAKANQ